MEGKRKIKEGIATEDIAKILCKYLADKPLKLENADSILDMIYWNYIEQNNLDNKRIRDLFDRLRELVPLKGRSFDAIYDLVCDLCLEHGRLAFIGGFGIGVKLMLEVSEDL